jgi:sodium/pantothenate symporter
MAGAIGRAIVPDLAVSDEISPWLAMNVMPPALSGIVLAGIVAGIQTTVAAMAIIIASSIAKNVLREFWPDVSTVTVKSASRWTMGLCLGIAIALAMLQPDLIQWIIFFSIGGLEAATFGPILLGMFWKRGNGWGALSSVTWGMVIYGLANTIFPGLALWGTHPSLVSVVSATAVYVLVSVLTAPPEKEVLRTFWAPPLVSRKRA